MTNDSEIFRGDSEDADPLAGAIVRFALARFDEDPSLSIQAVLAECTAAARERLEGLESFGLLPEQARRAVGSDPGDLAGSRVARYVLLSEIGRGGMGTVYRARDEVLDRVVAVKVLREPQSGRGDSTTRDDRLRRFRAEARLTGGLDHPGIVPILEFGELMDGRLFYAMKFVEGRTLQEVIEELERPDKEAHEVLPLHRRLELCESLCDILAFAHARGVVHRDIKPANVMVGAFGALYLLDWGLARSSAEEGASVGGPTRDASDPESRHGATRDGQVLGTPGYMAPEQVEGRPNDVDARTDTYAVGALLARLLGARVKHRAARGVLDRDRCPDARVMNLPRDLQAICRKAMEPDPGRRYQSATALRDDLRAYREARPVSARTGTPLSRISKWIRRHPTATFVTLLSCLIASLGWQAFTQLTDARRESSRLAFRQRVREFRRELGETLALPVIEGSGRHRIDEEAYARRVLDILKDLGAPIDASGERGATVANTNRLDALGSEVRDEALDRVADVSVHLSFLGAERIASGVGPAVKQMLDVAVGRVMRPSEAPRLISREMLMAYRECRAILEACEPGSPRNRLVKKLIGYVDDPSRGSAGLLEDFDRLSRLHREWIVQAVIRVGSGAEYLPILQRMYSTDPGSLVARLHLAMQLSGPRRTIEEHEQAVEHGAVLIASLEHEPAAWFGYGVALAGANRPAAAAQAFEFAATLAPGSVHVQQRLAVAREREGDVGGALTAWDEAIVLDPKSSRLREQRMALRSRVGRVDEAMEDFDLAQREPRYQLDLWAELAINLARAGRIDLASRVIDTARARKLHSTALEEAKLTIACARGTPETAKAELDALLDRDRGAESSLLLVKALLATNRAAEAQIVARSMPENESAVADAYASIAAYLSARAAPADEIDMLYSSALAAAPMRHDLRAASVENLVRSDRLDDACAELDRVRRVLSRQRVESGVTRDEIRPLVALVDRFSNGVPQQLSIDSAASADAVRRFRASLSRLRRDLQRGD